MADAEDVAAASEEGHPEQEVADEQLPESTSTPAALTDEPAKSDPPLSPTSRDPPAPPPKSDSPLDDLSAISALLPNIIFPSDRSTSTPPNRTSTPPPAASPTSPTSPPAPRPPPKPRPDLSEFDPYAPEPQSSAPDPPEKPAVAAAVPPATAIAVLTALPSSTAQGAPTTPALVPPVRQSSLRKEGGKGAIPRRKDSNGQDEPEFDFNRFLEQMRARTAEPVAKYLRSFLSGFSKRPYTVNEQIKLITDFMNFITKQMASVEPWRSASDPEFENACEAMEKLVMNRVYPLVFTPLQPESHRPSKTDDLERDAVLLQRIRLFSWVRGRHLDIALPGEEEAAQAAAEPEQEKEGAEETQAGEKGKAPAHIRTSSAGSTVGGVEGGYISFAVQELSKVNHYKAPRDKIICIMNCCKVITGLIRHLAGENGSGNAIGATGADTFVPLLIYVVLKANPEHLISNVEYINRFRNPAKLTGEQGYYFSSLLGAINFIETMDHSSLSDISQEEFERNVEAAISSLPSPSPSTHSLASEHFPPASPTSREGEESARALTLPGPTTTLAEDTKRFFQRTGESLSKPLSAIGRILGEAVEESRDSVRGWGAEAEKGLARVRSAGSSSATPSPPRSEDGHVQYATYPSSSSVGWGGGPALSQPSTGELAQDGYPGAPRSAVPPYHPSQPYPSQQYYYPQSAPPVPHGSHPAHAPPSPTLEDLTAQIDSATFARNLDTAKQVFPHVEPEVCELVLRAEGGDLGRAVERLLEMSSGG